MLTVALAATLGCPSPSGGNPDANPANDGAAGDAPAPGGCAQLDQAACDAATFCQSALGAPAEEVCIGNYDNWTSIYVECVDGSSGCDDVETCASDPVTGARMFFPDSCVPAGWLPCDCQVPATCENGGDPVQLGSLCVRGVIGETGETIDADTQVRIQATPYGCFGSGCVLTYDNVCAASVAGTDITLDSLFCIGPSGEPVCKPDCSGAGWAVCHTETLAAGTYTVSANGLSVSFTVPSEVPFGGLCDEIPL